MSSDTTLVSRTITATSLLAGLHRPSMPSGADTQASAQSLVKIPNTMTMRANSARDGRPGTVSAKAIGR